MPDLISMAGTTDLQNTIRSYFGAWPWQDPTVYLQHSPLMHVDRVRTATSLVHGGSDDRVPTSQAWEFYAALRKQHVPTDLLILPRQPHNAREPRLQRAVMQWHHDWLTRYTLGASAPTGLVKPRARPLSGQPITQEAKP